jgi:hypothetical protein
MRDLWFLEEGFEVGIFLATEDTEATEIPSTTLRTAFGRLLDMLYRDEYL